MVDMSHHAHIVALSYGFALFVLGIYGVEVCPYIEGVGYVGILPVFAGSFGIAFVFRNLALRKASVLPLRVLATDLLAWLFAGLLVALFDVLILGFPLGSGAKVMVGCVALGLPLSSYVSLLVERDVILEAQNSGERLPPRGPAWSISTRLYRFVLASQVLLVSVLVLLLAKDLSYVLEEVSQGRSVGLALVAFEITATFVILVGANALTARRYAKNLDLLLQGQLAGMEAVTSGRLDAVVPVVSNDEMAQIGDKTNTMIEALRERERIKSIFGKLLSPQVAQAILSENEGAELGGREIEAVVLFSDLRNFTTLSEECEPQEVVALLNEYLTMVVDAVHAEGGVVDKFIGDAAMAVFGLEGGDGQVSAADRAFRAALAMRQGLEPVNARLAARKLPQITQGVGLHFGPMVAGNIGSSDRLEYTVIGDAVNTASRLESLTKEMNTPLLVSERFHAHLSADLREQLRSLGECALRGKSQRIDVFGLTSS